MIPLRLQLKNFISYGNQVQTINFEPYHFICLSGKNGHGKSELLDALTWVLWGQARKSLNPSKIDEGLMRLGQSHMMVMLDFRHGPMTYRIRREYTLASSKAISHLDFGIVDEATQQVRSLSEKTIRATQEKINHTIRLDYDSFINSAFLRQGQSNEFSKKSPRERKEILANILGIDRYEELRKKAFEKGRTFAQEKEVLASTLAATQLELNQKGDVEKNLAETSAQLRDIAEHEHVFAKTLQELEERKRTLAEHHQAYTKLTLIEQHNRTTIEAQTQHIFEKVGAWRQVQRQKKNLAHVEAAATQQAEVEQRMQALSQSSSDYRLHLTELAAGKERIQKHKEALMRQHAAQVQEFARAKSGQETAVMHLQQQAVTLVTARESKQGELKKLVYEIELAEVTSKKILTATRSLDEQEKLFERRKGFYQRFVARASALKKDLQELVDKHGLVQTADACCPLCNQALARDACARLKETFSSKQRIVNHQIERLTAVLKSLKELLVKSHAELEALRSERAQHARIEARREELAQQKIKLVHMLEEHELALKQAQDAHRQAADALAVLIEQQSKHVALEAFISCDTVYQQLKGGLATQEVRAQELAARDLEYQEACRMLTELTKASNEHQAIRVQFELQEVRKREIHDLCALTKSLKKESVLLKQQLAQYRTHQDAVVVVRSDEERAQQRLKELQQRKELLMQRKGALEHHKVLIERKEAEERHQRVRLDELSAVAHEYQALAQALGKDGIQALLIEEAIPEIEAEANALLAQLTDNQAHLTIESLRDLKSGSTKETLDIKISDPLGIRPYELFSGGEAFRIDFALRIAISKLLAKRAGAALQILIIDEGFGSQDEDGLMHITDALHKIQENFAKVIVVSHLPTMKEYFPVQFHIFKGPQGSTLRIIEQG